MVSNFHTQILSQKITKLYITMRLYYAVKFLNREIRSSVKDNASSSASVRQSVTSRKMQKVIHES